MTHRRCFAWILPVLGIGLVASGCASIPTSGGVEAGEGEVAFDEDIYPIPPQIPEDDPERLVQGFLSASAAGVAGDFSDLRGYLIGEAATEWDPTTQVTIYGPGELTPVFDDAVGTVTFALPLVATVDSNGRMTEYEEGTTITAVFGMTKTMPGRWRISSLDDGIYISLASFDLVYRPVVLAFGSRDSEIVVPDLRWLPRRNIAAHATLALISGPSPWLADAVLTGFTPTAALVVDAVPVEDGRAIIALSEGSTGSVIERALALEQIGHTLSLLPDVPIAEVTVGGLPIGGDGSVLLSDPPVPSSRAAIITDGRLGIWDGEEVLIPSGGGRLPDGVRDIAFSYDGVTVAVVVGDGVLATTVMPGDLVPLEQAGTATDGALLETVFEGDRIVAPSFDRHGWLWTAESEGEGVLYAIDPDGEVVAIPIPGMEGRNIGGVAVSHDGVRIAVLSQEGGLWRLGIVALVRAEDGTPLSAGTPLDVGVGIEYSRVVTWVDDRVVAVLGTADAGEAGTIVLVTVGGRTARIAAQPDAVGLSARNGVGSMALVTDDGSLYIRVNTFWSHVASVSVTNLAFSG